MVKTILKNRDVFENFFCIFSGPEHTALPDNPFYLPIFSLAASLHLILEMCVWEEGGGGEVDYSCAKLHVKCTSK